MENVNIIPITEVIVSYQEGRCGLHPKLFSQLLVRAVFWKSSLHRQDKTTNVKWEHYMDFELNSVLFMGMGSPGMSLDTSFPIKTLRVHFGIHVSI